MRAFSSEKQVQSGEIITVDADRQYGELRWQECGNWRTLEPVHTLREQFRQRATLINVGQVGIWQAECGSPVASGM